jgi:hypothetical protein
MNRQTLLVEQTNRQNLKLFRGVSKNYATKMAEKFEQGGNFQIVFLIDVFVEEQNICEQDLEDIFNLKSRAISLCVLRLLLHFNSVVECGNFAPLKWGFKFYNSSVLNFEYKRRRFYELNSGSFEQFEEEMRQRFTNACSSQNSAKTAGVKSLSCCLTEILHDFPWVTPDISSPSRSAKYDQFNSQRKKPRNYLFVVGDCPLSDANMCRFLGRNESSFDAEVMFKEIFSTALYEEFHSKCGLSLFWIDSGLWCVAPEKLKTSVEVCVICYIFCCYGYRAVDGGRLGTYIIVKKIPRFLARKIGEVKIWSLCNLHKNI